MSCSLRVVDRLLDFCVLGIGLEECKAGTSWILCDTGATCYGRTVRILDGPNQEGSVSTETVDPPVYREITTLRHLRSIGSSDENDVWFQKGESVQVLAPSSIYNGMRGKIASDVVPGQGLYVEINEPIYPKFNKTKIYTVTRDLIKI